MIPPEAVRVALARRNHTPWDTARVFRVADRTVRRWMQTGLALYYGARSITREEWDAYAGGQVTADPKVSDVVKRVHTPSLPKVKPRPAPTGKQRQARGRSPKRKRLRTSRELLDAYKRLHSK